jgi:hypothetical protein
MTVGDEQAKSENDAYVRGFTAGYQARVREEIESWKAVIEGGQLVAFGDIMKTMPFADREAARLKTVREAHNAGVHGHSARGCPWCSVVAVHLAVDRAGCPNESSEICCAELGYCSMLRSNPIPGADDYIRKVNEHIASTETQGSHHNGDYGVCRHGFVPDKHDPAEECSRCLDGAAQNPAYGVATSGKCSCKPHPIFGHEDGCRYVGTGATQRMGPAGSAHGAPDFRDDGDV